MYNKKVAYTALKYLIASIWLINGLFCKILNLVPRHQQIVSVIAGYEYGAILTRGIGVAEIGMTVWIISNIKSRWCAFVQIVVIATMNIIEYLMVPHLLLFGKGNIFFASLLILFIYFYGFLLNKKPVSQHRL